MKLRAIAHVAVALAFLLLAGAAAAHEKVAGTYGQGPEVFSLATGSPGELGLLQALGEAFSKEQGGKTSLKWIKAGSGQSLQLLKDKKVDLIMVHAPKAGKQAAQDSWATKRTLIGSNEFFIVGPANDPAKIRETKSAVDAYKRIAAARAKFFSRGGQLRHPQEGNGHLAGGRHQTRGGLVCGHQDFMTATLKRANDERGYFMVDSSTWVAEKKNLPKLQCSSRVTRPW